MAAPPWCRVSLGLPGRALVSQVGDFQLHKGMSSCHSWCHAELCPGLRHSLTRKASQALGWLSYKGACYGRWGRTPTPPAAPRVTDPH